MIRAEDLPSDVRGALGRGPGVESPPASASDPGIRARVQAHERSLIESALRETRGNQSEVARRLRMPLRTLARSVKALGLKAT